jgi:GxxExxY protein
MLYEDLTSRILEACFEVANELGCGFLEPVYEKALLIVLREKGLSVESQFPIRVFFRDTEIGEYFADLVVEGKVVVEIKAVKTLAPEHSAQVIHYLKATGIEVGLLVNFGTSKIEYKRLYKPGNQRDMQDK